MAYRSGRGLWRFRRFSLRGSALTPIFSRTAANDPSAIGLADAEEVVLDTADGERVIVWHPQWTACLCLFSRQRRLATLAGRAFS
jgi:hypothetical protein